MRRMNSVRLRASRTALVATARRRSTRRTRSSRLKFIIARTARSIDSVSEASRRERAPAEPHHLLDAVDDLDVTFAAHVRHDHMYGVGSDIDRSQPHG